MLFSKFKKIYLNIFFLLFLCFLAGLISGCNEKPTGIGMPLLFDTITVLPFGANDTGIFTRQRSFYNNLHIFNVGVIYVGNTKDTKAATLLRFSESNMPDSLSYLDASQIISVTLTVHPNKYTYGDLNSNFLSFKIFKVKQGNYWSNLATWDSLYNKDDSPKIFEPNSIAQWSGTIPMIDTIPAISIPITDFNFVKEWIAAVNNKTDTIPVWGLGLLPDDNSTVIHQFIGLTLNNIDLSPILKIIYKNKNTGLQDSLFMKSGINASFIKSPEADTTSITVQGTTSWRSQLFFDVSRLPKNASVYKAQLELTYNSEKSLIGNLPVDSVLDAGLFLNDSIWISPTVPYYASLSGNKYTFPRINSSVEYWLRHNGIGNLVFISPGWSEYYKLDRVSFYGINEADVTKRPKLIIIYSKRPY